VSSKRRRKKPSWLNLTIRNLLGGTEKKHENLGHGGEVSTPLGPPDEADLNDLFTSPRKEISFLNVVLILEYCTVETILKLNNPACNTSSSESSTVH
jgi:hypothetical protein